MARGTGTVTVKFLGDVSNLKKASDDADGALGKVGSAVGGAVKTLTAVGIPALVGFGAASVKAFADSEKVAAQTGAVIKSTGGAAKVTADQVGALAGSLSAMSGVDDEVIQSGENMLLTFTNIQNRAGKGKDIFNQATAAALDMSVAMGEDITSSAMRLGKALNDPVAGVSALRKVGVQLTDQQKKQIETMMAAGDVAGAQAVILKELQVEFGGSAKAAGDTFAGQLGKLKVQLGNVMEEVGSRLVPILTGFASLISDTIGPIVTKVTEYFNLWRSGGIDLAGAIAGLISEDLRFLPVIEQVIDTVKGVIGWITNLAGAFRGGGDSMGETGTKIRGVVTQLQDTFSSAFGAIRAIVATAADFVRGVWRVFGDDLLSFARETWAGLLETIRGALNVLTGIFDLIKAVLTGKWGDAWTAIKKIVDGAWDAIFGVVRNAVTNVIPTILAGLGQAVSSIARTAFDGLKEHFKAALNWVIDRWNGLEFQIPGFKIGPVGYDGFTLGVPDVPRLAGGGTFNGAAIVGEAGPELLVGSGRVIPNNQLGGNTYQIAVTAIDPRSASEAVVNAIREYESRNGPDWRS